MRVLQPMAVDIDYDLPNVATILPAWTTTTSTVISGSWDQAYLSAKKRAERALKSSEPEGWGALDSHLTFAGTVLETFTAIVGIRIDEDQKDFLSDFVEHFCTKLKNLEDQYVNDVLRIENELGKIGKSTGKDSARVRLDSDYSTNFFSIKKICMEQVFKIAVVEMLSKLGLSPNQHSELVAELSIRLAAAIDGTPGIPSQQSQSAATLPTEAPELYCNRPIIDHDTGERENIEQFLTRVYAEEIKAGILTEPALSRLDKTAYNVLRANKASFPDLKIPNKQELMKRDELDPEQIRQAQRVMQRSYREQAGQKPPSVRGR
jgi:hypothetical protein